MSEHLKPYELLANAIICRAADDYKDALRILKHRRHDRPRSHAEICAQLTKNDCERFFKSSYFEMITGANGEYIMRKLKEEFEEEEAAIKRGEHIERKHRSFK